MRISRVFKVITLIISMFCLTVTPIFAQDGVAQICDLQEVIVNGFNFIIAVFPFLGLGVLITGTFFWMTSQGDPQKLQRARDTLTYGVIGFILGISAVLIVGTLELFLLDVDYSWTDEEGDFQFVRVQICEISAYKPLGSACSDDSECESGCCRYREARGGNVCVATSACE